MGNFCTLLSLKDSRFITHNCGIRKIQLIFYVHIYIKSKSKLWQEGSLIKLFTEGQLIQYRLKVMNSTCEISVISKKFKLLMQKGDVNATSNLLSNNTRNRTLPLNNDTLILIDQKHLPNFFLYLHVLVVLVLICL